jgi:hypothetical protein
MSFKYCLAMVLVPCAVGAQQNNPADPLASVPAASHVSAFKDYRSADYPTTTPDLAWRSANARVASEASGAHGMHAAMPSMSPRHQSPPVEVKVKVKTGADPHANRADHNSHEGHR